MPAGTLSDKYLTVIVMMAFNLWEGAKSPTSEINICRSWSGTW